MFQPDNLANRLLIHSKLQTKLLLRKIPGSIKTTNFAHDIFGQFCFPVRGPFSNETATVVDGIGRVVLDRSSRQIFDTIVCLNVVQVADYSIGRPLRRQKSIRDQVVDFADSLFPVKT
jgi:hypothetical protein